MGHIERQRIIETKKLVQQLGVLGVPSGCLHASILAMGASNIHIHDVVTSFENNTGIPNLQAYLHYQGLSLGGSIGLDRPLSLSQTKRVLETPKSVVHELNDNRNFGKRVAGILIAFGNYNDEPPHVVGILPRGDMTRNLRRILKKDDSHVVVDTSSNVKPIYPMTIKSITENLNAFILNHIDVSLHVVTRLNN